MPLLGWLAGGHSSQAVCMELSRVLDSVLHRLSSECWIFSWQHAKKLQATGCNKLRAQ